jgi:DNA end-binding protein Ku
MPRSIWKGSISFGLVNVPVKLYSAVSKKTVRFNQLHDADHGRIEMKRFCKADGQEVPYEQIIKGFEISPGEYVPITQEELDGIAPEKARTIDIEDFVELAGIDPVYFEHPYYLAPDTGAAKAYKLLLTALRETDKVAIARVVIRQKEYLTAIRASGEVLTMETMVFADEVVDPGQIEEIPDDTVKTTEREVEMARALIESQATSFDPSRYGDEYRRRVMELIERKAEGKRVVAPAAAEAPSEVPDLMAALEASLAAAETRKAGKAGKAAGRAGKAGGAKRPTGAGSPGRPAAKRAAPKTPAKPAAPKRSRAKPKA